MKHTNEDLSLATKVKIVGSMALVSALFVVSVGIGVALQKENKVQAAALAKTQMANVEAMRTVFPDYKNTDKFKEMVANMPIVKVSVEDLPTTITAGLDETVDPNPECQSLGGDHEPWSWHIALNGTSTVASYNGATGFPGEGDNGWSVSEGGVVNIPDTAIPGTYILTYTIQTEDCPYGIAYTYVFKITPPCPTGVTLTVSATPQE